MKFFDLEIDDFLSAVNSKTGGRSVSYAEGTDCKYYKYTHGHSYRTCAIEHFKDSSVSTCQTWTEPIQK